MKNKILLAFFVLISYNSFAQIQISKLIGKNASQFKTGYGAFLKFGVPVSDAADVSLEIGVNNFQLKADPAYGGITFPIKVGYRYTLNKTGTGFYLQPQAGYNIIGYDPDDNKFKGLVLAAGAGYLFESAGIIQFDLGLIYETAFHKEGAANYLSFRLSHNIVFGGRNKD